MCLGEGILWFNHLYSTTSFHKILWLLSYPRKGQGYTVLLDGGLIKGAKVYPASRRRSNKRVGLKGQLAPQRYTLLLDGGLIKGWGSRTAGSSLCAMIKQFYHGIQKAVDQFRFKNFEHLLLGSGGEPQFKTPPARTFHTPVGTLRLDAPALVWVRSPNDGNKLGLSSLSTLPVLRVLFWCNLFDVSSVFWPFFQANLILIIILIDPV